MTSTRYTYQTKDWTRHRIPKGGGRFREIYVPSKMYKKELQELLPELEKLANAHDKRRANHAFRKGRNCVTHALCHVGYAFHLSLDIQDFFDSVSERNVDHIIPRDIIEKCFIDNAPRQGLPTSPLIATIALFKVDEEILAALERLGLAVAYSRYADDLGFSFQSRRDAAAIKIIAEQALANHGFRVNKAKTRLQSRENGNIVVAGLALGVDEIRPTRKTKKKLRAALHQGNVGSATGLAEWCKCKLPRAVSRV